MQDKPLFGVRVALLATNGYDLAEMKAAFDALQNTGAEVHVVSLQLGRIQSWEAQGWSDTHRVDVCLDDVNPEDYDALVLPGGPLHTDRLRMDPRAIVFVESFLFRRKPIAAIGHAPQILIETGFLVDKKMTSYRSIRTDLINAGVDWADRAVVVDDHLVTSRGREDLPVFIETMLEIFQSVRPTRQTPDPRDEEISAEFYPSWH